MVKRLFDIVLSSVALIVLLPVFGIAAIGIRLSSRGSIFYRAERVGLNGKCFVMYKFRTMHVIQPNNKSVITAEKDPRVFKFGSLLRNLKIDELPQLINILKGEMSIVGPRPEDPKIVKEYYTDEQLKTLSIVPGLASPGSIYNYTHGEKFLAGAEPEESYVKELLPIKLSLESVYIREASFWYDMAIIGRTIWVIVLKALGKRDFPEPRELKNIK
jgi:lipopolysaccharide/colanic/teichoic acid biosynthesis glycosyltransferase